MSAAASFAVGLVLGGAMGVLMMAMLYMLRDPEKGGEG